MKHAISFSAIIGLAFLSIRLVGLFVDLPYNNLFLILGLGILLLVTLPLYLLEQSRYAKMKESILRDYKKEKTTDKKEGIKKKTDVNYPAFRRQKSGLTWRGGSVHGSSAQRNERKGFLKH